MNAVSPRSRAPRFVMTPHSRALRRGVLGVTCDGRSREARFLRAYEAELVNHLGGEVSFTQRQLIARAARLALRLELMDERFIRDGEATGHDHRQFLAEHNGLVRTLAHLGMKPAAARPPSLAEILAAEPEAPEPEDHTEIAEPAEDADGEVAPR